MSRRAVAHGVEHPMQLPSDSTSTAVEVLFLTISCGIEDLFMVWILGFRTSGFYPSS